MIVLDLRERNEVEVRPLLAESINIPAFSHFTAALYLIKEDQPDSEFLLICSSGNRAKMIYDKLSDEDKSRCECFDGNVAQFNILIQKKKGAV